MFLRENSEHV